MVQVRLEADIYTCMTKLKKLVKEGLESVEMLTPKDIYNFYFLWWTAVNQPKLVSTNYGKEIMNHYLTQWKIKYTKAFKKLIAIQIGKYIQRGRVDPDFPKDAAAKLMSMSASQLQSLMAKTFRSDMQRRNDRWELVADFVTKLESANSPKDIFVYVNQLNNAVHNTQTRVLDKMPNYYSELMKAFDFVDKAKSPQLQLKGLVDKDIRDLWNQEEQGDPHETDPDQSTRYTERIMMREGLEKVLRMNEASVKISRADRENVAFMTGLKDAVQDKANERKRDLSGENSDYVRGYNTVPREGWWSKMNDRLTRWAAEFGNSYGNRH